MQTPIQNSSDDIVDSTKYALQAMLLNLGAHDAPLDDETEAKILADSEHKEYVLFNEMLFSVAESMFLRSLTKDQRFAHWRRQYLETDIVFKPYIVNLFHKKEHDGQ